MKQPVPVLTAANRTSEALYLNYECNIVRGGKQRLSKGRQNRVSACLPDYLEGDVTVAAPDAVGIEITSIKGEDFLH